MEKGVIYPVPTQPCFQSRIFTVRRQDGRTPRIKIDLSSLNQYVHALQFQLENHSTLPKMLVPQAYMAALDISEAYTHIPMQPALLSGIFVSEPTLLFSCSSLRSQCDTVSIHQDHGLASSNPLHTGVNVLAYLDNSDRLIQSR